MSTTIANPHPTSGWLSVNAIRTGLVAMVFLTSFYTTPNPAPCDLFLVLALLACVGGGLNLSTVLMPLLLILLIYNLAGFFSYLLVPTGSANARDYIIGLAYTSTSGLFLAAYLAQDPVIRFRSVIRAWWFGASIGAAIGLAGYFDLPPFSTVFPDFAGRVVGGYKDPNVFSTWLIFPVVAMLQAFIIGSSRINIWNGTGFLLMFSALFLAFSRGAWINTAMSMGLMIGLTYLLSPSRVTRGRIVIYGIAGTVLLTLILSILLSVPAVKELFLDRFTLVKNYDAGETGRFGNQLRSIPLLMEQPFGFGPMQFKQIFNMDPHNTFVNAFASGGWLGGMAYLLLVISTFYVGVRTAWMRTPFQPYAISCFSCFVTMALQGVQIDMENWRHYYWLIGMIWGFSAAGMAYLHRPATFHDVAAGWNLPTMRGGR